MDDGDKTDSFNDAEGCGGGDDEDLKRIEKSFLQACRKEAAVSLEDIFRGFEEITKIGEGALGEVFEGKGALSGGGSGGDTEGGGSPHGKNIVFKLVPLQGSLEVTTYRQRTLEEMEPEVRITHALSNLASSTEGRYSSPGFVKLETAFLGRGRYPAKLLKAWKTWDEQFKSENKPPELFDASQRYMVLLFQNGGVDAASYKYYDAQQAFSMIMQVIHSLAVAEAALEFEHRDLHEGNILISSTPNETITYRFNGTEAQVPSFGVSAVMIDFAWSRIREPAEAEPIVMPMSQHPAMFMGYGDFQYMIYRQMRDLNCDDWTTFTPKTNLKWIYYLCRRMLRDDVDYKHCETHQHLFYTRMINHVQNWVEAFPSCQAFVSSSVCTELLTAAPRQAFLNLSLDEIKILT